MRRAGVAGVLSVALIAGCTADAEPAPAPSSAPSSAPVFAPGAEGIGDPYFPKYGNGGYDVAGYDLKVRYDPRTDQLTGTATITATATQDLSRFNLDLSKLAAKNVTVDGVRAGSSASGAELTVTPAAGIPNGRAFTTVIEYGGKPAQLGDAVLGQGGWLESPQGAIALGQPESASTWFPVNDHPLDKATFKLEMTVPAGVEAISNGVPGPQRTSDGWTTWSWSQSAPMASYLAMVVIGQYRVTTTEHNGKPMVIAVAEALPADGPAARSLAKTAEITDFLATKFGPYPFDANGGVAVDDRRIGYALETQSRPVYGPAFFTGGANEGVIAHELAHQWFGDSVALEKWQDIWLNEGFATYAEWLWDEHSGGDSVQANFDNVYNSYPWNQPGQAGNPGASRIFGQAVYQRGGMTVFALRKAIGDPAFDQLLKRWTSEHKDGNANTDDLIAMAEEISGKQLDDLFKSWLFSEEKPAKP
ncbi:M1 family metallopeptidase [Paractinoplanes lichenicola]|uniref:Aminopeptidase N n=1 Tax=Paractinoplanes lichenicola TaxID=2802976 RepID=A0ABS1VQI7_9ACTN|nr:M1 family metallopeptidase [Actinoplanes lichenicola]MBL7256982.1 M1 family metallopeptidase [Actinoplanes lichenicola]